MPDYDAWLAERRRRDPKYIGVNPEAMRAWRAKYSGQRRSDPLEEGELRLALAMPPRRVRVLAKRYGVDVEDMGYEEGRPRRPVYSFMSSRPGAVTKMWSLMASAEVAWCKEHGVCKMAGF